MRDLSSGKFRILQSNDLPKVALALITKKQTQPVISEYWLRGREPMPESPALHYPDLRDTSGHTKTIAAGNRPKYFLGYQPAFASFSQICGERKNKLTRGVTTHSDNFGLFMSRRIGRQLPNASKFSSWQPNGLRLHIIEHACDLVAAIDLLPLKDF